MALQTMVEIDEPGVQLRREQPRRQRNSRVMLVVILCGIILQIALIMHDGHTNPGIWMTLVGYTLLAPSFAMNSRPFVIDAEGIHLPSRPRMIPWNRVASVHAGNRFENGVWLILNDGKKIALPLAREKTPAVEALFASYGAMPPQ